MKAEELNRIAKECALSIRQHNMGKLAASTLEDEIAIVKVAMEKTLHLFGHSWPWTATSPSQKP